MINVPRTSALTLQEQLYRRLREQIEGGVYQPGDKLPSENQLIAEHHVSRVTVRAALAQLVDEGIVIKRQGKGTFVKPAFYHEGATKIVSFSEACRNLGIEPSTKIISIGRGKAPDDVARSLFDREGEGAAALPGNESAVESDEVVELVRVRSADGAPCILEVDYLPARFDFLMRLDLTDASLIQLISAHTGIAVTHFNDYFYAVRATRQHADVLDVRPGTPLLKVDERCRDDAGRIVYVNHQIIVTDRYVYSSASAR